MNYDRQLQGSFWLMIALQTIGAIDMPGKGPRKLPAPRTYVAVIVLWSILGLVSDAGAAKAAAVMGWITVLTGAVVGPFGLTATNFLTTISSKFGVAPGGAPVSPTSPSVSPFGTNPPGTPGVVGGRPAIFSGPGNNTQTA